jgi:HAD superfamily hydrolase (TIGR01509 family)
MSSVAMTSTLGVIFDIDGTLVDSVDLHAQAWQEAFRHFGRAIPFNRIREQIGKGGDQLLPVFLPPQELDSVGAEIDQFRSRIYQERYLPRVRAFPGVRALFQRIAAAGREIALASSAKGEELATYKRVAGIGDLLAAETSSDEVERSKPYPDIFEAALRRLGLPAERVIAVGDTQYDAEAAAKAGMRAVGLLCGGFPRAVLEQAGYIAIYRDPEDLLAQFEGSPLAA